MAWAHDTLEMMDQYSDADNLLKEGTTYQANAEIGDNEGAERYQFQGERVNTVGIASTSQQRLSLGRAAATHSRANGQHSEGATSLERRAYNAPQDSNKIRNRQTPNAYQPLQENEAQESRHKIDGIGEGSAS